MSRGPGVQLASGAEGVLEEQEDRGNSSAVNLDFQRRQPAFVPAVLDFFVRDFSAFFREALFWHEAERDIASTGLYMWLRRRAALGGMNV